MTDNLPPLPYHPEPRIMTWSESERRSIREYGEECARAAASPAAILDLMDELQTLRSERTAWRVTAENADAYPSIPKAKGLTMTDLTNKYAEAWKASFLSANPYHTVVIRDEDVVHMEAGVAAATAPLLARIEELAEDVERFRIDALNEKAARQELEAKLAQSVPDERAAFEKWFKPYWEGRHSDLAPWAGWQARALLSAAPAAPEQQEPPKRCPNCDDTGDVHSIDGEWRGTCHCPAGQQLKTQPVAQASNAQQAEAQEPVYWQWRRKADQWTLENTFNGKVFPMTKGSEVRLLFTRPQPAQLQHLTPDEIWSSGEIMQCNADLYLRMEGLERIAKAVSKALAAKNGAVLV